MIYALHNMLRQLIPRKLRFWPSLMMAHRVNENIIIYHFLQRVRCTHTMVDVGAAHGSLLLPFAEDGWTIHAFEPNPETRAVLARRMLKYPTVTVNGEAVSDTNATEVLYYGSRDFVGIGSLAPFHASHEPLTRVATLRLDTYLPAGTSVDYLKVDTEGYDLFVLKGYPWSSSRPTVVMCEFENRKSIPLGYTFHDLAKFLVDLNYSVLISEYTPVEDYSLEPLWRHFKPYPCDLVDDRDAGNIIAISDPKLFARFLRMANAYEGRYVRRGLSARIRA